MERNIRYWTNSTSIINNCFLWQSTCMYIYSVHVCMLGAKYRFGPSVDFVEQTSDPQSEQ